MRLGRTDRLVNRSGNEWTGLAGGAIRLWRFRQAGVWGQKSCAARDSLVLVAGGCGCRDHLSAVLVPLARCDALPGIVATRASVFGFRISAFLRSSVLGFVRISQVAPKSARKGCRRRCRRILEQL